MSAPDEIVRVAWLWSQRADNDLRAAVSARYPGDYDPITLGEARKAVSIARRVRKQEQVRAHLLKPKRRSAA
jgi:hypothetical protein